MTLPPGALALSPDTVAVLGAALRPGRLTVREVASRADVPVQRAYAILETLRTAGLMTWEPGVGGSMRALVRVVAL
jgi:sugar-specific transcriptional regulator TrmB